ncbi:MAG TPA: DUF1987 domain-containing protein [Spirochaetia bacterium]|nr:DUF1987 domain-containing protein [Spirochaetia bacterium]
MESLSIKSGVSSPSVDFDPETGLLRMGGESYPENSFEFYTPIIAWLTGYLSDVTHPVRFLVELSYLNTSSTKCMIDLLDQLEAGFKQGVKVSVDWYYDRDNERARDTIEEFREDFTMPFNVIAREG